MVLRRPSLEIDIPLQTTIQAMELNQQFAAFLTGIRPPRALQDQAIAAFHALHQALQADRNTSSHVVSVFLEGSFRRSTALRPRESSPLDVDVIIVTTFERTRVTPEQVLRGFRAFLQRQYEGRWSARGRTIELDAVSTRLGVIVACQSARPELLQGESTATGLDDDPAVSPAEREAWQMAPLYIPNRERSRWEPTHPFAQLAWTRTKNVNCNGHYLGVVRAIKWWRRVHPGLSGQPQSYPLEHLVGVCCPDGIRSVAEGIARTFEAIVTRFEPVAMVGRRPSLPNHGLSQQDVFARVSTDDFAAFIRAAAEAARQAQAALSEPDPAESERRWRRFFSAKFPS